MLNRAEKNKLYFSTRWRALSRAQLSKEPLCSRCFDKTPREFKRARVADHIDPTWNLQGTKEQIKHRFYTAKLSSLCRECHNLKSHTEDLILKKKIEKTKMKFF